MYAWVDLATAVVATIQNTRRATTLHLLLMWQATVPSFVHLLPLTMHLTPQATPDTAIRWTWILLLVLAASTLAYTRRAVPLRLSLRTQDPHA